MQTETSTVNNNAKPLADLNVLVTRPQQQAQGFIARIAELGGKPCHLPTIEIRYNSDNPVKWSEADLFIFTSVNSVKGGLAQLPLSPGNMPQGTLPRIAAIGQSTAKALAKAGMQNVICPEQNGNSEVLLKMLTPNIAAGTRVIIVRGDSGRDTLRKGLSELGANVSYQQVYERRLPDASTISPGAGALWLQCPPDIVSISSDLGLENLVALLPADLHEQLLRTPLIVNSARCRDKARGDGFSAYIRVAHPPGDQGQIDGLIEFARSLQPPVG